MEEITVHKLKWTLEELEEALHIKGVIASVYASSFSGKGYLEITLEDENK